jgi:hypothetical protein
MSPKRHVQYMGPTNLIEFESVGGVRRRGLK